MLDRLVAIALMFGAWPAYVAVARHAYRRGGGRALLALWIGASLLYGYAQYRWSCAQPLTCDVGGTSRWFMGGNPRYFVHLVPQFTAIALAAFGAGSVVVARLHARDAGPGRTLALGTAAAIGAFVVAIAAHEVLKSLNLVWH
jgi:hypothetical protein